jgi:hypothetical protein
MIPVVLDAGGDDSGIAGWLYGVGLAGLVAPTDAQQGEGYRIIFIHVPASWMSMFIYLVMAFWAGLGLAFNTRLSGMMATGAGAHRCAVRLPLAVDRRAVGQTDVGRLVGVGCAPDLGADPALPLRRLHRPAVARSTIRAGPTRPAPSWRWSAWSTCRSSTSR